jgi:hypothetical protein
MPAAPTLKNCFALSKNECLATKWKTTPLQLSLSSSTGAGSSLALPRRQKRLSQQRKAIAAP